MSARERVTDIAEFRRLHPEFDASAMLRGDDEPSEAAPVAPVLPIVQQRAVEPYPTMDDAALARLPDPVMAVDGIATTDSLVLIYGKPGSYKTFLSLSFACSLQTDRPWFGRRVTPGRVLYLFAEGRSGMKQRVEALKLLHGLDHVGWHFLSVAPKLTSAADVERVLATIAECDPAYVFIDTKERHIEGNENAQETMGPFVTACHAIRDAGRGGRTVFVVDHSGWNDEHNRGSTVLWSAADTVMHLTREKGETVVSIECDKERDIEPFATFTLQFQPVIGTHSAVLIPSAAAGEGGSRTGTDGGRVLDVIRRAQPVSKTALREMVRVGGPISNPRIDDALERLRMAGLARYATIDGVAGWCLASDTTVGGEALPRPLARGRGGGRWPDDVEEADGAGTGRAVAGAGRAPAGDAGTAGLEDLPACRGSIAPGSGRVGPEEDNLSLPGPSSSSARDDSRTDEPARAGGAELL